MTHMNLKLVDGNNCRDILFSFAPMQEAETALLASVVLTDWWGMRRTEVGLSVGQCRLLMATLKQALEAVPNVTAPGSGDTDRCEPGGHSVLVAES